MTTPVTERIGSPSMATMASVRSVTIFFFWASLKTPSISFTVIRGMRFLLG
jgi:hypothetical protein